MLIFKLYSHFPGIGVGIRSGKYRGNADKPRPDRVGDIGLLLTDT